MPKAGNAAFKTMERQKAVRVIGKLREKSCMTAKAVERQNAINYR